MMSSEERSGTSTGMARDVAVRSVAPGLPSRLDVSPGQTEAGLGQLVLTVIELIRQVLEHQAVRRLEGGRLTDEEVERLGTALMQLDDRLAAVRETFGLSEDDLNIDLGPLGQLL